MPPAAVTLAAPFDPALHDTFVCDTKVDVNNVGCVILSVLVIEQLLTSLIVQL